MTLTGHLKVLAPEQSWPYGAKLAVRCPLRGQAIEPWGRRPWQRAGLGHAVLSTVSEIRSLGSEEDKQQMCEGGELREGRKEHCPAGSRPFSG